MLDTPASRPTPHSMAFVALLGALAAPPAPASACDPGAFTPIGFEQTMNDVTTGDQNDPVVSMSPVDGRAVVAWVSDTDIYMQAGGAADVRVNNITAGEQRNPHISHAPDGSFVIVWESEADGSLYGIEARMFGPLGAPLAGEFAVNTVTAGNQTSPRVDHNTSGGFVVVWTGIDGNETGIKAQGFNSAGAPFGSEIQVNATQSGFQLDPDVGVAASGGFYVIWTDANGLDGNLYGVYGQAFNSVGATVGGQFRVNQVTAGNQEQARISVSAGGGFAAAWVSQLAPNRRNIVMRYFNVLHLPLSDDFQVNGASIDDSIRPQLVELSDGFHLVGWMSDDLLPPLFDRFIAVCTTRHGVNGAQFALDGGTPSAIEPALAGWSGDEIAAVWNNPTGVDGDGEGIRALRYTYAATSAVREEPAATGLVHRATPAVFDRSVRLEWEMPFAAAPRVTLHDITGRLVRVLDAGSPRAAGAHALRWDGRADGGAPVRSGVYFYRIDDGRSVRAAGRMVRVRS